MLEYEAKSAGAEGYRELAAEIIAREIRRLAPSENVPVAFGESTK